MKTIFRIYNELCSPTPGWVVFEKGEARYTDKRAEATKFYSFSETEYILQIILCNNAKLNNPKEMELEIRKYYTN